MTGDLIQNAPIWMVYFAFWASLILTLLTIGEILSRVLSRPKLDLRLTKDVFFRLTEGGERLFCSPVLLAWKGPILVIDAAAELYKTDNPKKSFSMEILAFGEKVRGSNIFADHYFPTQSPLSYVPEAMPQRAVYMCVQREYRSRSEQEHTDFRRNILQYKAQAITRLTDAPGTTTEHDRKRIIKDIDKIVDDTSARMMDLVQLEPGSYTLTLSIGYRNPISRFWNKRKESQSSISFVVSPDVRESLRTSLHQTLAALALNLIFDRADFFPYPEYQPLRISEHH